MRPHMPTVAAIVATVLFLFSSPAQAGKLRPQSRLVAKAGASSNVVGARTCETNVFPTPSTGGFVCYGPRAIRGAYGLTKLISRYTGAGQTIVILAAFGSPTALEDLRTFDKFYGVPNPPSFTVVHVPGAPPPPFDSTNDDQIMWAREVSLDVQWAHVIAPGANIVLVAAASDSDEDLLAGLNHAINQNLGDVISMSFGESEALLTDADGLQLVARWEKAFKRARDRRITLFVSSGDYGSTNAVDDFGDILGFQNVSYPASSPQVTAVGGTDLFFGKDGHADPTGKYLGETVWNDAPFNMVGAGGGGVSALFGRPDFQDKLPSSVLQSLDDRRGMPDIAFTAGRVTGVVVYEGFYADTTNNGFKVIGGTSVGPPQWAGIVADLNQALGRQLGFINNRLYRLGRFGVNEREEHERGWRQDEDGDRDHDQANLFHDITVGDNGFCGYTVDFESVCVPGFDATPGWDLATGWGTPSFGKMMVLFDQWDGDDDDCDHDHDHDHDNDNDRDDNDHNKNNRDRN